MAEKGPGKIVRALRNLGTVGILALGAEACTTEPQTNETISSTSYEVKKAALTQVVNVGVAKPIAWSTNISAGSSNFSVKGDTTRFLVDGGNGVFYQDCDDKTQLIDCISNGTPKSIQGLNTTKDVTKPPFGPFRSPGTYVDKNGNEKFLLWGKAQFGKQGVYEGDLSTNPAGDLEAKNLIKVSPVIPDEVSIFDYNGSPHALHSIGFKNLIDGTVIPSPQDYKDAPCGPATYDDKMKIAIGGHYSVDLAGNQNCTLGVASSIEELGTNPIPLVSLNQKSPSQWMTNPRLAGNDKVGRVVVFSDGNPGQEQLMVASVSYGDKPVDTDATGDTTKIDADGGPTPDGTADGQTDQDVVIDVNEADIIEVKDDASDATPDAAEDADAGTPPELPKTDVQPDSPDAAADGQTDDTSKPPEVAPDTAPDTATDTPKPPEVTPAACDFAKAKISVKIGDCALENCTDPLVDIKGKCTVEIDLGKTNPVVLEIDGTYGVDLLEQYGSLLAGKYRVKDNGNHFNTVMGDFGTGVEGTTYSGELPDDTHYIFGCEEGSVNLYWKPKNGPKQLLGNFKDGKSQTFDINNPQPQPEPTPDTSQAEPDNKDAGTPGAETSPETGPETASDTGKPSVTPKAPTDGCKASNTSDGHWGVVGLALLAAASLIKRRRKA